MNENDKNSYTLDLSKKTNKLNVKFQKKKKRRLKSKHFIIKKSSLRNLSKKKKDNQKIIDRCFCCNQKGHFHKNCPKIKCFICNKKGHKSNSCPLNKNNNKIPKCDRCNNYGHYNKDCLINPIINKINLNDSCYFCGKKHFICPFEEPPFIISDYDSDNATISSSDDDNNDNDKYEKNIRYIKNFRVNKDNFYSILNYFKNEIKRLNYENNNSNKNYLKKKKLNERIFKDIKNEDIYKTIFCYKCGGKHSSKFCFNDGKNENKENNYLLNIIEEGKYKVKNPLKYEPILPKEEFTINHHNQNNDYYNDTDSSGESYEKMYKNK